jgi:hypothetical protein
MTGWEMWMLTFVARGRAGRLTHLVRALAVPPLTWLRNSPDMPVSLLLQAESPAACNCQPHPRRLALNRPALLPGPIWYLLTGPRTHASIPVTTMRPGPSRRGPPR